MRRYFVLPLAKTAEGIELRGRDSSRRKISSSKLLSTDKIDSKNAVVFCRLVLASMGGHNRGLLRRQRYARHCKHRQKIPTVKRRRVFLCRLVHIHAARSIFRLGVLKRSFAPICRLARGSRPQRVLTILVPYHLWGAAQKMPRGKGSTPGKTENSEYEKRAQFASKRARFDSKRYFRVAGYPHKLICD